MCLLYILYPLTIAYLGVHLHLDFGWFLFLKSFVRHCFMFCSHRKFHLICRLENDFSNQDLEVWGENFSCMMLLIKIVLLNIWLRNLVLFPVLFCAPTSKIMHYFVLVYFFINKSSALLKSGKQRWCTLCIQVAYKKLQNKQTKKQMHKVALIKTNLTTIKVILEFQILVILHFLLNVGSLQ